MGTDKKQVIAYVGDELHQALLKYQSEHGHKSASIAIAAILSSALLGESLGKAPTNSDALLSDLLARLDAIEQRLSKLESKALPRQVPTPSPSNTADSALLPSGDWLTPKQAFDLLGERLGLSYKGFLSALDRGGRAGQLPQKLAAGGLEADFSRRDGTNRAKWLRFTRT